MKLSGIHSLDPGPCPLPFPLLNEQYFPDESLMMGRRRDKINAGRHLFSIIGPTVPDDFMPARSINFVQKCPNASSRQIIDSESGLGCFRDIEYDTGRGIEGIGNILVQMKFPWQF